VTDGAVAECVLVRHGETTGNSSVRLYGATDIPLSDAGRAQMRCVAALLSGETFDRVISSPLVRSVESARIVSGGTPTVEPGFTEIDFGRWEGLTFDEVEARHPEDFAAWETEGLAFSFPDGEGRRAFHERVREASRRVLHRPGRTLAVVHKGIIKVSLATLLELPADEIRSWPVDLGGVYRLRLTADGWVVTARNEIAHLGETRTPDEIR